MLFEVTQVITLSVHHSALTLLLDSNYVQAVSIVVHSLSSLVKEYSFFFQACTETKNLIIVRKEQASLTFTLYLCLPSVLIL